MYEGDNCGSRMISINDADFFGTPERPKEVMRALKGRGVRWQAGVTSKLAQDDAMLELAAESGCTMLSIGFESISRDTLKSVHKHVNRPEQFAALVEKVHSYGIAVFGLFMFGFDGDDKESFQDTARRSEEHTSELQSRQYLVCRLLLEKTKINCNTFLTPEIPILHHQTDLIFNAVPRILPYMSRK